MGVLRIGKAWTQFRKRAERPIALWILANCCRQFNVQRVGCSDAGGGNREIGRGATQRLVDVAGGDPVVAMRQHVDAAQEVDTHPTCDQKSWQVI